MFTPEKMEQIHILFYEKDVHAVSEVVVRQGSVQLVDTADMEPWAEVLDKGTISDDLSSLTSRRDKVETVLKELHLPIRTSGAAPWDESWELFDQHVNTIQNRLREDAEERDDIETELGRLRELKNRVQELPATQFQLQESGSYTYLTLKTGRIEDEHIGLLKENLKPLLHVMTTLGSFGGRTTVLVMTLRRDTDALEKALFDVGFQPLDLEKDTDSYSPELIQSLDNQIEDAREKLRQVDDRIKILAGKEGPLLHSLLIRVRRDILKETILKYFRKTDRTFLLSGWIPREKRELFSQEVRKATQNRCIIEVVSADKVSSVREGRVDVPVQMKNPALIKPFELITSAYGIPSYRTIDPTPVLGISFLMMFGMMFGDVGHGLVLVLLGLFLFWKGRAITQKHAGLLLIYGGAASMIFGFLFGSVFGVEHWLPTLWVKPMESITELFRISIYFGIGMIFSAIGINLINSIRKRDFLGVIFDKAGLLSAILYWCGIVVATRVITSGAEARGSVHVLVPLLLAASVVLLFLREPIIHLIQGKKELFPEGLATGIMGGIVEILEILLGFLANTVSFIRVAAFGLAHAGLFMAIFALSDANSGVIGSWLVLIIGNIIIIALEGLVVSIQAVRLEFYEFFSRFFEQGGVGYTPVGSEMD